MEDTYPSDENVTMRLATISSINKSDHAALLSTTMIVDDKDLRPKDFKFADRYGQKKQEQKKTVGSPKQKCRCLTRQSLSVKIIVCGSPKP